MSDTGNAKDCLELPPTIFFIFTLKKKRDLISFTAQFSISFCLYRACFTHLNSSNLSCNLCLWYYNQLVHFDKEINANEYHHCLSWIILNVFIVHEWHLTPHMTLSIETCVRRTPCIKRTPQHSPRVSA